MLKTSHLNSSAREWPHNNEKVHYVTKTHWFSVLIPWSRYFVTSAPTQILDLHEIVVAHVFVAVVCNDQALANLKWRVSEDDEVATAAGAEAAGIG
jgi:hypothetical protein